MRLIGLLVMVAMLSTTLAYPDNVTVSQDNLTAWRALDQNIQIGDEISIGCIYECHTSSILPLEKEE